MARSAAYPVINLQTAVEKTEALHHAFTRGSFGREAANEAMSYSKKSGHGHRIVAALNHYGLLDRESNSYKISEIGLKVAKPVSDDERQTAVKSAALNPKLIRNVYDDFKGSALPGRLENILDRKHNIAASVADDVAQTVRETLEFAGLLKNGIVGNEETVYRGSDDSDDKQNPSKAATSGFAGFEDFGTISQQPKNVDFKDKAEPNLPPIPIPLKDGRRALLSMPEDLHKEDVERIYSIIKAYAGVKDEQK